MRAIQEKTDSDLIRKYLSGDERSFRTLVQRYQTQIFTFILRMIGDRAAAQDVFQEVFVRASQNLAAYQESDRFGGWIFTIARNLCHDHLRRRQLELNLFSRNSWDDSDAVALDVIPSDAPLADAVLEQQELAVLLSDAIAALPIPQREVLLLRQHSQLTFKEIAGTLDRPLNTVLSQMRHALCAIRNYLEKEYAK